MSKPRLKNSDSLFLRAVLISLLLHFLVLGIFFGLTRGSFSSFKPPVAIKTKLVKLGKKRNKKFLPRKVTKNRVAKLKSKKSVVKSQKKSKKTTDAKKKRGKKSKSKLKNKVKNKARGPSAKDKLSRLIKKWDDEGLEQGSIHGSQLQGNLLQDYSHQVALLVQEAFEVPSILSSAQRKNLSVLAKLRIGSEGELLTVEVQKSSGVNFFDNSVIEGAKKVDSFGPPPIQLRSKFTKVGIIFKFCPIQCKED